MGGGTKAGAEGATVGNRGVGKMKEAVAGSEAEGLYGLLRRVTSCSHPHPSQPPLKSLVLPPAPPSPNHLLRSPQDLKSLILQIRLQASPAAPPAPEEAIPAHMQPL